MHYKYTLHSSCLVVSSVLNNLIHLTNERGEEESNYKATAFITDVKLLWEKSQGALMFTLQRWSCVSLTTCQVVVQ